MLLLSVPLALSAQITRKIEGEVGGSVFFGNTRQTVATTRAQYERKDSVFAFRTRGRFNYGELTQPTGGTAVNKRSWEAGANYDFRPFDDITPFFRVNLESSLENRIQRRTSAGLGTRYNIVRTSATDVMLSVGAVGEHTIPSRRSATADVTTLARGTTMLRVRRDFTPTITFTSESSYEPALQETSDYTITTVNTLKVRLARFAALTLTLRDNYDNRAVARGARVNNDGELLMGVLTSF